MTDKKTDEKEIKEKVKKKSSLVDGLKELMKTFRLIAFMGLLIASLIGGYLIGSRTFELGYVKNKLHGATVLMSGTCKSDGQIRPTLNEDQVKIIRYDQKEKKYHGVLIKFRESIECDHDSVHLDFLPLYDYIVNGKVLESPEVKLEKRKEKSKKEMSKIYLLAQKTVSVTGTCSDENNQLIKPAFVAETVAVSNVVQKKMENGIDYEIQGTVTKGDRKGKVVACLESKIQVRELTAKDILEKVAQEKGKSDKIAENVASKVSYKGKGMAITGVCFPYKTKEMEKGSWCPGEKSAPAFYTYQSTSIKVLNEEFDKDGKELMRIIGSVKDPKNGCIRFVDCDKKKQPELYFEPIE